MLLNLPSKGFVHVFGVLVLLTLILTSAVVLKGINESHELRSKAVENKDNLWLSEGQAVSQNKLKPAETILEIALTYDPSRSSVFTIDDLQRKKGYVPTYPPEKDYHVLELIDNLGKTIYKLSFAVPKNIGQAPPPITPQAIVQQSKSIDAAQAIKFSLTIPWHQTATNLKISDQLGRVLIEKKLSNIKVIENKPRFKSIPAEAFLQKQQKSFLHQSLLTSIFSPHVQAEASPAAVVDITFIGDKYAPGNGVTIFHNDVNRVINHLLTYEPFKGRPQDLVFHYVDNTTNLECGNFDCNDQKVIQALNDAGVPHDTVIVLVNVPNYDGNADNQIAVSYNGEFAPQVAVHEFGHSFGRLVDEYTKYSNDGVIDNEVHFNCLQGAPPTAQWEGIVQLQDYRSGCSYRNWYRSSPESIMLTINAHYFNAVSQAILSKQIDFYTKTNVLQLLSPRQGDIVARMFPIETTSVDNIWFQYLELFLDGSVISSSSFSKIQFNLDSTRFPDGIHTMYVRAQDRIGNIITSDVITLKYAIQQSHLAHHLGINLAI